MIELHLKHSRNPAHHVGGPGSARSWTFTVAALIVLAFAPTSCSDDEGSVDTGVNDDAGGDAESDTGDGSDTGQAEEDSAADLEDDVVDSGDDSAAVDDGDLADANSDVGLSEPAELLGLSITIGGLAPAEVDLLGGDDVVRLITPAPANFRLRTRDDDTATADLVVDVIDAEGNPYPDQVKEFRNGLWRIDVQVDVGTTARVRVVDGDEQAAITEFTLYFPSKAESLQRIFELRSWVPTEEVASRWDVDFSELGVFCETRDTDDDLGGSYTVDADGLLHLADRHRIDCGTDNSAEWDTIEQERVGEFFIDATYYEFAPFTHEDADGLLGTWTSSWTVHEPAGEALVLVETHTVILTAEVGNWTETHAVIDHSDGDSTTSTVYAGTWIVEDSENYEENLGNFWIRTVTTIDGDFADEEWYDLFHLVGTYLLINPAVDF